MDWDYLSGFVLFCLFLSAVFAVLGQVGRQSGAIKCLGWRGRGELPMFQALMRPFLTRSIVSRALRNNALPELKDGLRSRRDSPGRELLRSS